MQIFPFAMLTWREAAVGFVPTEMTYMQVERNWVSGSKPGYRGYGSGEAMGKNLGHVRWRMTEETFNDRRLTRLHSEAYNRQAGYLQTEDVFFDPASKVIVGQVEQKTTMLGTLKSTATFFEDRIALERTGPDGRTVSVNMVPEGGMAAVQMRFEAVGKSPKEFLVLDGIAGKFRKVRVERAGRFRGKWGIDKYEGNVFRFSCEGKEQTAMLTEQGELVRVEFDKEHSLALMGQARSKRYEEQRKVGSGS